MIKIAKVPCRTQNHNNMNYEYICLNSNCLKQERQISCLYCCQDLHQSHVKDVHSIKVMISKIAQKYQESDQRIFKALVEGIHKDKPQKQFKQNLRQLIKFKNKIERFQIDIDEETKEFNKQTRNHYTKQVNLREKIESNNKYITKSFLNPILSFQQEENYRLKTPFSVETLLSRQIVTVFAQPSLTKHYSSIQKTIKIQKFTPSWIGLGLSIGKTKYEDKSPNHLILISNGWLSNRGELEKTRVKFGMGDQITVKWNKNTQLVEFSNSKDRHTQRFENKWDQEIYLCICLFYKGDSVTILS